MTDQDIPMGQAPVIKHLIDVSSGDKAEAIYFNRPEKQVICLSCQLSCPVGCVFCASPDGNPTVNLTVYDMLDQIKVMSQTAVPGKPMLISFMGEGEPALNIDRIMAVMQFLSLQDHPYPIRFAISTSGVKPSAILKLLDFTKDFALPVKLQLSLHAPTDEGRAKIIPVSKPLSGIIPVSIISPTVKIQMPPAVKPDPHGVSHEPDIWKHLDLSKILATLPQQPTHTRVDEEDCRHPNRY